MFEKSISQINLNTDFPGRARQCVERTTLSIPGKGEKTRIRALKTETAKSNIT